MLIEIRAQILFITGILFLFRIINANLSRPLDKKAERLLQNICENLPYDSSYSKENQQREKFCQNWIKSLDDDIHREIGKDELYMEQSRQPRRVGGTSRSGSRSSSSRVSSSSSRVGSRISSLATRYRSSRTGASISRPSGWLWSRSRHVFLPVSQHYYYRSYSSHHRYTTTPSLSSGAYYYCTSNISISKEIQCSTINGDGQCCEDETTRHVYCCGGSIDADFVEDFSQATRILSQIFYTLSAIALVMHILMRRFHQ